MAIGVVSGIVGITSYRVTFHGAANHAGTTPMDTRLDAGLGASTFLLTAREMVVRDFPGCVVNVGQMQFKPGGFNIIPGAAELALEFRSEDPRQLAQLETALLSLADLVARQYGLTHTAEPLGSCTPAPMSARAQAAFAAAAESLALIAHHPAVGRRPRRADPGAADRGRHDLHPVARRASATRRASSATGRRASTAPTCCCGPR